MNDPAGQSGERFQAFLETMHEGVFEVDRQGNVLYFNNAFCEIVGHPREAIQGKPLSGFLEKGDAGETMEAFRRIRRTGRGVPNLVARVLDRDGNRRIIELSASAVTGPDGESIGVRGVVRNVTETSLAQEALQESNWDYQCKYEASQAAEKTYRTLLEFMPHPMVVFSRKGRVVYLNPAFTKTFGWTLEELEGETIPYMPREPGAATLREPTPLPGAQPPARYVTRRMTKDGRMLDVIINETVYSEDGETPGGKLVLLRDITRERRMARTNEALNRISKALPKYPVLTNLLDYISSEIMNLLNAEGAVVILLDEERHEFFFEGLSYEDEDAQRRAREVRYSADTGVASRVIKTGKPAIVEDVAGDPDFNPVVEKKVGFPVENLIMVPLRGSSRVIGVLNGINRKDGVFGKEDAELLGMIGATVALSVENAKYAKEIMEAYREIAGLNRAKDRVINHLSHELKTPVSILIGSLDILKRRLREVPPETWAPTFERALRNLRRIVEIQYQVEDIMEEKDFKPHFLLTVLLEQCRDELETLVAQEVGEGPVTRRIRDRIEEIFGPRKSPLERISLHRYVEWRLKELQGMHAHRQVRVETHMNPAPDICIPRDVLQKVVDGLVKNALEATPDGGRVEVTVHGRGKGAELIVKDEGVGIRQEDQKRIFEGFFSTQETMDYSSRRPFDFNAGGKGADLLRMKIFAERYHFDIAMESERCPHLVREGAKCPGAIRECPFCKEERDCRDSGGTRFTVYFPAAPEDGCRSLEPAAAPPDGAG